MATNQAKLTAWALGCVAQVNSEYIDDWQRMVAEHDAEPGEMSWSLMCTTVDSDLMVVIPAGESTMRGSGYNRALLYISGESGSPMVDYYNEFGLSEKWLERLRVLLAPRLYFEWENPGLIGIYEL